VDLWAPLLTHASRSPSLNLKHHHHHRHRPL
jgi:hypothetical protein